MEYKVPRKRSRFGRSNREPLAENQPVQPVFHINTIEKGLGRASRSGRCLVVCVDSVCLHVRNYGNSVLSIVNFHRLNYDAG